MDVVIEVSIPQATDIVAVADSADITADPSGATVILVPSPGPPGPPGAADALSVTATASQDLSGHRVVTPGAGGLEYASAANAAHAAAPLWLTTGAIEDSAAADVTTQGVVIEPSWSWAPGPLWLGDNGTLTPTAPVDAVFLRQVAAVVAPDRIFFHPQQAIVIGE